MSGRTNAYNTLTEATQALEAKGYKANFYINAHDCLQEHPETAESFAANKVLLIEFHRFEGASDPADQAVIYALETPTGVRGTLIDAFGPESDPNVDAFLRQLNVVHQVANEPKH